MDTGIDVVDMTFYIYLQKSLINSRQIDIFDLQAKPNGLEIGQKLHRTHPFICVFLQKLLLTNVLI